MTATCISGGIRYSSGESATSPMRQRSCGADVAVISSGLREWNGGCSFSTHSQSSVCLPGPANSTAEGGGGGGGDASKQSESFCLLPSEASMVQALMD